jgi:hypothetical protein
LCTNLFGLELAVLVVVALVQRLVSRKSWPPNVAIAVRRSTALDFDLHPFVDTCWSADC